MSLYFTLYPTSTVGIAASGADAACRVLTRQLQERGIRVTDADGDITVYLRLSAKSDNSEAFTVVTGNDGNAADGKNSSTDSTGKQKSVTITSASSAGLLYGVGEFLRRIAYFADGHAEIPPIDCRDEPQMPWRAVMTCYHHQDNGYKYWDTARERQYLEDMALWGESFAMFSPLNMLQRNSRTLIDGTPENAEWKTMSSMPSVADELGLKYGLLNVPNDVFKDDMEHCKKSTVGAGQMMFADGVCACPSDPNALRLILQRRDEFFAKLSKVDFLYIHPSDYGGCSCKECGPYIPTYLKLAEQVAARMRKYHPNAKVYVGTVLITEEGIRKYVIPYLNSHESSWLNGIVYGMHGTAVSLTELSQSIPKRLEIILYPEITMVENWGRIGASPWVRHFAYSLEKTQDMGKECIRLNAWPNTSEQMFGEKFPPSFVPETMSQLISGAFVYSEGLHDDITKVIWLRYCWNPKEPRENVLKSYCRFYYGEEAADLACTAILLMEDISYRRDSKLFCPPLTYHDGGKGLSQSERVFALLTEMKRRMPDWAKTNWRYLFLELRSRLDLAAFRLRDGVPKDGEKDAILNLAEEIYRQTCHVSILPAGSPWNRDNASAALDKLLQTPKVAAIVPPTAPRSV